LDSTRKGAVETTSPLSLWKCQGTRRSNTIAARAFSVELEDYNNCNSKHPFSVPKRQRPMQADLIINRLLSQDFVEYWFSIFMTK
jgi:hypothetical protein